MILYNITVIVDSDLEVEFREWAHRVFLPQLAIKQLFKSLSLLKVLDSPNEGATFSLQLIAANEESIKEFQDNHLPTLHNKTQESVWSNKIFLFETKMEYITLL